MIDYTKYNFTKANAGNLQFDQGLRSFMLQVYNYMAIALILTGIVSYIAGNSVSFTSMLYQVQAGKPVGISGFGYLVMFSPLVIAITFSFGLASMSFENAKTLFWVYAICVGLSISSIFLIYQGASIARVFFITASVFGAMSLYGYTTKKDLTNFGAFLIMGLIGIILASVVNMFLKSSAMEFALSILGTLIFVGLTAYDTQRIKTLYLQAGDQPVNKIALMGAFTLFMDFINLFLHLLRFLGDRRDS